MSHQPYQLNGVSIGHGNHTVLRQVNLTIQPGESVAVIGRSGAGKSTLLRYLYEQAPQQAAWIPQSSGLVHNLSVYHNIYMGRLDQYPVWRNLINLFRPFAINRAEILALMEKLEFSDKLFSIAENLSGGQQQRTAVARALYQNKCVVLGDEPISAVDPQHARRIIQCMSQSCDTLILALHDIHIALECTQRIIGIKSGCIALDAPSDKLQFSDLRDFYAD